MNYKRIISLIIILILISFIGCITLSKSQLSKINNFAKAVDEFTDWPSIVFDMTAEIRFKRGLLEHSTLALEDSMFDAVNLSYESYKKELEKAQKFDVSLELIKTYAECLAVLSSGKVEEDLENKLSSAGNKIDRLIKKYNGLDDVDRKILPVASDVTEILTTPGKIYFKIRSTKLLKKFISLGDDIINKTTGNISNYLDRYIKERIGHEEERIKNVFKNVLIASKKSKPMEYLKIFERYKNLLDDLENTKELTKLTKKSFDKLGRAHSKVKDKVTGDKKIDEAVKEIYELYKDVKDGSEIVRTLAR